MCRGTPVSFFGFPSPLLPMNPVDEILRPSPAIEGSVDHLFYCWKRVPSMRQGVEEDFQVCKASDFWRVIYDQRKYTDFISSYVKPKGVQTVSMRSRKTFKFGDFTLMTKLPRAQGGPMLWFGFEHDDLFAGGAAHFCWHSNKGTLTANVGGISKLISMDLTKFLPPDSDSKYHWYSINVRRGVILWYVDGKLRALASTALGDRREGEVIHSDFPYAAGWTTDPPSPNLAVLLDIDGGREVEFNWADLNPWGLRVSNGDPQAPVRLRLYTAGSETAWSGRKVQAGEELTSSPLPGTGNKSLTLWAPRGTVTVEYFTEGGWIESGEAEVMGVWTWRSQDEVPMLRFRYRAREGGEIRTASLSLT